MKKTVLTLCVGMIIGLMAGTASGAFAAVGDKVEAIFSEFTILVNGDKQALDATPLVYNGTSYLPVRSLANIVGFDVTYLSDTRTIELNTAKAVTQEVNGMDTNQIDLIAEQQRRIEFFADSKANSLQEKINFQSKIDSIIEELTRNGQSEEDIKKHPLIMQYRGMLKNIEEQISNTEKLITEVELQKATLEEK